jgi:hypothetical protein
VLLLRRLSSVGLDQCMLPTLGDHRPQGRVLTLYHNKPSVQTKPHIGAILRRKELTSSKNVWLGLRYRVYSTATREECRDKATESCKKHNHHKNSFYLPSLFGVVYVIHRTNDKKKQYHGCRGYVQIAIQATVFVESVNQNVNLVIKQI